MTSFLRRCVFLLSAWVLLGQPAYAVEKAHIVAGSDAEAYRYVLENGMRLIVVPDKRNPLATVHFILDAGSNREKPGTTGLAHFFEHMMFRKTQHAPEGEYDRVLNAVGGTGNAGTSDSFVTFYATFPSPALETMLKLESERFLRLDLAEPYFSREKGAVISERKLRVENDPLERTEETIRAQTQRGTPLEWMTIGLKQDVQNMKLESAQEFYNDFYTPDNTLLVVGGPFKPQDVLQAVTTYFGPWKGHLVKKHPAYDPNFLTRDAQKSFVCGAPLYTKTYTLVYPSAEKSLDTIVYTTLLQALLDDNPDGTLNRRLTKANIATNLSFYQVYWQDQIAPYEVRFSLTAQQDFQDAKSFWLKNIADLNTKPLTNKVKNQVLKQMAVSNAEVADRMTSLVETVLESQFFLQDFFVAGKAENIVRHLTEQKFKSWLKKTFSDQNFYTTGVVPVSQASVCP